MFRLTRITTVPNSIMQCLVDGDDQTFMGGAALYFSPAGQDGDSAMVTERVARILLSDPGLAAHFECAPPLPQPAAARLVESAQEAAPEQAESAALPETAQDDAGGEKTQGKHPKGRKKSDG